MDREPRDHGAPSAPRAPRLWAYRELALALALKTLRVRYKQTIFGIAWAVLQPLLAVVVFTIVFGRLAGLPTDGIPYAVFNYAAMIVWLYVAGSVNAAAQSLVESRDMVSKVFFPRLVAPLSSVVPGLVDLAIASVVLVGMLVVYDVTPSWAILLTPAWVLAAPRSRSRSASRSRRPTCASVTCVTHCRSSSRYGSSRARWSTRARSSRAAGSTSTP